MKFMNNSRAYTYACVSALCLFALPVVSIAAPILDFGIISPTNGMLSYAGADSSLIGSSIEVDHVVGLDSFANDGVVAACSSCSLNFQTGASEGGWDFGAGGVITLTGGIDFPDSTTNITTGSTLLHGTFNSATVVDLGSGAYQFQIVGGSFTDTKHPELLAFYGMPSGQYIGGLNISFSTSSNLGEAFSSDVIYSGGITNTPIPLPGAIWLLGGGLLGLVSLSRRKPT
jgi:hypothetical protein